MRVIDPENTYLFLNADGQTRQTPGGAAFWSLTEAELAAWGRGWLVSEFQFDSDWPNWEMHPEGDEIVYLLQGEVELVLELPTGRESQRIVGRGAVVVSRGVWHTARTRTPCRMLHITMGQGTQSRPT